MVSLLDIKEARTQLQGVTVRTPLIEFDRSARVPHVSRPLRDVGTFADADRRLFLKPENQHPSEPSNWAELTTKSHLSPKPSVNAASSPTPAAITRKA